MVVIIKLHLNARGSALLESGLIKFLRKDNSLRPFNQHRSEGELSKPGAH